MTCTLCQKSTGAHVQPPHSNLLVHAAAHSERVPSFFRSLHRLRYVALELAKLCDIFSDGMRVNPWWLLIMPSGFCFFFSLFIRRPFCQFFLSACTLDKLFSVLANPCVPVSCDGPRTLRVYKEQTLLYLVFLSAQRHRRPQIAFRGNSVEICSCFHRVASTRVGTTVLHGDCLNFSSTGA